MKKLRLLLFLIMLVSISAGAQPERIGAGLSFATKRRFNNGDTGNPGLNIKTWIPIDKNKAFQIVPAVTVFNPLHTSPNPAWVVTTYMFHADMDVQYRIFKENTLQLIALAGANYTYISSKINILSPSAVPPINGPIDSTLSGFGPTIGAALEMRMSPAIDFILTGRYSFTGLQPGDPKLDERFLVAPLSTPVIQIHAVYYFVSRGRGYYRR